jgi:hypothetical protein
MSHDEVSISHEPKLFYTFSFTITLVTVIRLELQSCADGSFPNTGTIAAIHLLLFWF